MADARLTKVSFMRAIYLCMLVIFMPAIFIKEEERDNEEQKKLSQPPPVYRQCAVIIHRAFWASFFMVIVSALIGYIIGQVSNKLLGSVPKAVITLSQITGAMFLLWGTLFVRGWEIQSLDGVTLSERVNKWIYYALYCVGTAVIVWSLVIISQ